ncbi:hypothetical protein EVG20_g7498, partial [Dentipellis fragilis]
MPCLARGARLALRSLRCSFLRSIPIQTSRTFSITTQSRNDLFDYTSGRWIAQACLQRRGTISTRSAIRRPGPDDVVDLKKLAEGGFNRTFLITMRDGFQMVARIPYPVTAPKYLAFASEVATMDLLRSSGLPVPRIYGYSPAPDNEAETEGGCILRQLLELESKMMSIAFPAGGSLYYAKDLKKVSGRPGNLLEDAQFCVDESTVAALARAADKEIAILKRFGRPLLPFQRMRREAYYYQEQSPSDHIKNLERYLLIAPSLVPRNQVLSHIRIRHPDLQPSNVIVSRSPDSDLRVIGLFDWQHTTILPMFLLAGIPDRIQNYDDPFSQSMLRHSLPENFDDLDEAGQSREKEIYCGRLIHHHYVKIIEEHNALHHASLADPMDIIRRRLFCGASEPWEGETLGLKVALIEATEKWETLTGGRTPCPVVFDAEDVRKTMELDNVQREADEMFEGSASWLPNEDYDSDEERDEVMSHWFLEDMDEEKSSSGPRRTNRPIDQYSSQIIPYLPTTMSGSPTPLPTGTPTDPDRKYTPQESPFATAYRDWAAKGPISLPPPRAQHISLSGCYSTIDALAKELQVDPSALREVSMQLCQPMGRVYTNIEPVPVVEVTGHQLERLRILAEKNDVPTGTVDIMLPPGTKDDIREAHVFGATTVAVSVKVRMDYPDGNRTSPSNDRFAEALTSRRPLRGSSISEPRDPSSSSCLLPLLPPWQTKSVPDASSSSSQDQARTSKPSSTPKTPPPSPTPKSCSSFPTAKPHTASPAPRAPHPPIPTDYLALQPYLKAHVASGAIREDYDREVARRVAAAQPDLVVLAGWMHILSDAFLDALAPTPVINLHPALP